MKVEYVSMRKEIDTDTETIAQVLTGVIGHMAV